MMLCSRASDSLLNFFIAGIGCKRLQAFKPWSTWRSLTLDNGPQRRGTQQGLERLTGRVHESIAVQLS